MLKKKGVLLAGTFGNALEWYDFSIYAFFVPILAPIFFPTKDPIMGLLSTLGIFAMGFLVRPLGAILFGYISDHQGRKKSLILSMIMMSGPTLCIALLPTYQQVGLWAPIFLTILRIIQGLAVSGELTVATVFLVEHADNHRRGLAGSMAMSGALFGIVASSIIASMIAGLLTKEIMMQWGWRLPFVIGGLTGIIGLLIRLKSEESTVYKEHSTLNNHGNRQSISLQQHIKSLNIKTVVEGVFLTSIMAIANYFLIAFFNLFLVQTQQLPLGPVTAINSIAITAQFIFSLGMGRLSDVIGRKYVLRFGIISLVLLAYPIFWLLLQQNLWLVFVAEILFALATSAVSGVIPTTLAELFDTHNRTLGISLCYNIALAIFGGTVPIVALTLVSITKSQYAPAGYVVIFGIIALIALSRIKETYQKTLVIT